MKRGGGGKKSEQPLNKKKISKWPIIHKTMLNFTTDQGNAN